MKPIRVVSIMEAQFVTGPAKPLLEFADRARESNDDLPPIDQSVVTYHRDPGLSPEDNPFVAAARRAAVPVDIVYEKGAFDGSAIPQIKAILERHQPDIVETHNVKSHFLMRYSGLGRKYPWIGFFHGYVTSDLKMRLYNKLDYWSLRAATHVIAVCGPFRTIMESQGVNPSRLSVQHNPIQPFAPVAAAAAEQVRRSLPCSPDTPLLLSVGRLSFEKGHVDLIAALALLRQRNVPFHLLIVGEGPERAAIEKAREELRMQAYITLAGHRNDVRPYYAAATLYLMPSHSEGSPLALLEAMIAGVPVIASRAGGIPEIVTDESTGVLTPKRNPQAVAAAIERLLADPDLRNNLANNALRETARFSPEAYRRNLIGVYRQVLSEQISDKQGSRG